MTDTPAAPTTPEGRAEHHHWHKMIGDSCEDFAGDCSHAARIARIEAEARSTPVEALDVKRLAAALRAADKAGAWDGPTPEDRLTNFAAGIADEYARLSRTSDDT